MDSISLYGTVILLSGVTSHYVIDQSMISICEMQTLLGGKAKQNPRVSI